MTVLINHPLFRSLLVASCMLCVDTPRIVPPQPNNTRRNTDENTTSPQSMKVTGDPTKGRRRRSAKPKRVHSKTIIDSGATVHCIRDKSLFTYLDTSKHVKLRVADNRQILSVGVGTCAIKLKSADGQYHDFVLHNCIYSPYFSENLISTRRMWLDNKLSTHRVKIVILSPTTLKTDITSRTIAQVIYKQRLDA